MTLWRRWRWLYIVLLTYLILTYLADYEADLHYRYRLVQHLNALGSQGFAQTDKMESRLRGDSEMQIYKSVLKFTPPLGWYYLQPLEHLDEVVLYASKNMALPEGQRFPDADEARKFGFDSSRQTPGDVAHDMFSQFFSGTE